MEDQKPHEHYYQMCKIIENEDMATVRVMILCIKCGDIKIQTIRDAS